MKTSPPQNNINNDIKFKNQLITRIDPISKTDLPPLVKVAFERHVQEFNARITNMKGTPGHSLLALETYVQYYPLYGQVKKIPGKRIACLFAYVISKGSDCPLCSTFIRKIIIGAGLLSR